MLRVLIADRLPDSARTRLQAADCEVIVDAGLSGDSLTAALAEHRPEVLIVRSTRVGAADFDAASPLTLVVRAGAGVNTIDLAAASARGVYVANCPGKNAIAVAELAWGHILNADRRIADNVADLRQGQWRKKTYAKARGLHGRTLGVVGCGDIGRAVIARAHAFGMPVVAWSRSLTDELASGLGVRRAASAVEVAKAADVLTVHLALTPATRGFIGPAVLDALRPGATLVNTSRGEVIDELALARAVSERGIRAALDVFCDEPSSDGAWKPALADLPGVYGTHHIGASTDQSQEAVAHEACRIVLTYGASGTVPNCVNLAQHTPATHLLVVRHQDEVGVLAGVLDLLREAGINVQTMENIIFGASESGGAACARIQIVGDPGDDVVAGLGVLPPIIDVKLVPLEVS